MEMTIKTLKEWISDCNDSDVVVFDLSRSDNAPLKCDTTTSAGGEFIFHLDI